ncbi:Hypothetical predicted protein [Paramuricea clavata]|uniref:Uncharacterized protein n=1 Tax=Paramuricea clavata TaxID=317549 RepID=A0A6S7GQZ9_PARCT|nr:Hypothetical predicted protein [Paramuricea clavata]
MKIGKYTKQTNFLTLPDGIVCNTLKQSSIQTSENLTDILALVSETNTGENSFLDSEQFKKAKKVFKQAVIEARRALHVKALSSEERILAATVLLGSGMLEQLDDPKTVVSDCEHYLNDLHNLLAIPEIYSVHFMKGIKSFFKKDSRARILESVAAISLVLAEFISKFRKERIALFDWPLVKHDEHKLAINPILYQQKSKQNLNDQRDSPVWNNKVLQGERIPNPSGNCSLNSKGDLVCLLSGKDDKCGLGKLSGATGELQLFPLSPSKNIKTENIKYCCVAVDEDDRMYVLSWYDDDVGYKLSVYTKDGVIQYHCEVNVHIVQQSCYIAVTKDKKIVICGVDDDGEIVVHLCRISEDQEPQMQLLTLTTDLRNHLLESVFVSCKNEIIVTTINVTKQSNVLYIYTEDGQLQRTVEFRPSKGNKYLSVCYNQDNIIGFHVANRKIFVEYLSAETGELQVTYLLSTTNFPVNISYFHLVCHTNGTLALIDDKHVILLRKM